MRRTLVTLATAACLLILPVTSDAAGPQLAGTVRTEIIGTVDFDTLATVVLSLERLPERLEVRINSPGGGVDAAREIVHLFEASQSAGITVACTVSGEAASAAFWILQACTERHMTADSALMAHAPFALASPGTPITARLAREIATHLDSDSLDIARIVAPRLGMSVSTYLELMDRVGLDGWRLNAVSAVRAGAVDSVD